DAIPPSTVRRSSNPKNLPTTSGRAPIAEQESGTDDFRTCGNASGRRATASFLIRLLGDILPLPYGRQRGAASEVLGGILRRPWWATLEIRRGFDCYTGAASGASIKTNERHISGRAGSVANRQR